MLEDRRILYGFILLYTFGFFCYLGNAITVLYESPQSCSLSGHDYPCTPPFTNVIKAAKVTVSSSCGQQLPDDICPFLKYKSTFYKKDCRICDPKAKESEYGVNYLSDPHSLYNQTCWFSGPIYDQSNLNHVNISLAFNKRFEVYYLALQFCTEMPDNVEIYKSSDYGYTWSPWQYFSKDCVTEYGLQPTNDYSHIETDSRVLSPTCIDLLQMHKQGNLGLAESILPFSSTIGRKINESLIDFITVTNIRITLSKFRAQKNTHFDYAKYFFGRDRTGREILNMSSFSMGDATSAKIYYGISDLSIGGRCQCHGHSNRCIIKDDGRTICDCQHNTDGVDCDKCKEGYHDLPWARATRVNANSCRRCHCNLHSRVCQFSQDVYVVSGMKSGGVCHKCLHNTAGRHCHYCEDGFYRDWSKPLSHDQACQKCKCHAVGSTNANFCDKKSGQCFCKDGVMGKRCDRCKLGYTQTKSVTTPCKKNRDIFASPVRYPRYDYNKHDNNDQHMANTESECKPCDEKRKRIRFKKFCRRNAVFMGTIQSKEVHGKMVRFEIQIKDIWRLNGPAATYIPMDGFGQYSVPLWIPHDDVRCDCPSVYLGKSYLILMKFKTYSYRDRNELMLDSRSVMLQWRPPWGRRLLKFQSKAKNTKCERSRSRKSSQMSSKALSNR